MPFNATRSVAAGFAVPLTLSLGLILGQGAQAQQAAPAQAPQGAPPQQPVGPIKLDLKPSQSEWTKVCGTPPSGKQVCFTTRDFVQAPDQPPLIALAVYEAKGDDPIVRFLMPPGLLIRPGIRFQVDGKGPVQDAAYTICLPNGCFAENKVKGAIIGGMKTATNLNVVAKNSVNAEVTFVVPLAGFGKAFDGPPVDPKELQKQQEAQQAELQRQMEEKAKEQREMLEKSGGGAAPAAPGAPAHAAPAPAAPKP